MEYFGAFCLVAISVTKANLNPRKIAGQAQSYAQLNT